MADAYDPVKLVLDDQPKAILKVMDNLVFQNQQYQEMLDRRRWHPWILFLAGLVLGAIHFLHPFGIHWFLWTAIAFCVLALVVKIKQWRARPGTNFSPDFFVAREVLHTLRDDLRPDRGFFGHIDLTGWEKDSKVAQQRENALGATIAYYRDEWLSLRGKLYDGNVLRLAAIRRAKVRKAYWKSSGRKMKRKPVQYKANIQELRVRISVNLNEYEISGLPTGTRVGGCVVETADTSGGIVNLVATGGQDMKSEDILGVLKWAYGSLQRRSPA